MPDGVGEGNQAVALEEDDPHHVEEPPHGQLKQTCAFHLWQRREKSASDIL